MKYVGEKPKRKNYLHFEKVRILFRPKWIEVAFDDVGDPGGTPYALYYHAPKYLVRRYPTFDAASAAARRLQARFLGERVPVFIWPGRPRSF